MALNVCGHTYHTRFSARREGGGGGGEGGAIKTIIIEVAPIHISATLYDLLILLY